jgi:ABC-type transport system involved in multi-copper enzyme maturation permease subunit
MIRFNFRIVFANRFIWFLLASVGFYIGLTVIYAFSENISRMEDMYGILLFSGILVVFYPTVFGIQNDQDARTIEILFGIPNYRYKVWLVRIILTFLMAFIILLIFALLSSAFLVSFNPVIMAAQVMMPVLFLGVMAFMLSTIVRNGNGTAVIMLIFGILFMVTSDALERSRWNVFLNPFKVPNNISETAWQSIAVDNRIALACAIALFLLAALYNLQKREKFM